MSKKMVLAIVEDHTLLRENLKLGLERFDAFQVQYDFENGALAYEFFSEHPDQLPDLILMDVCMPEMDGFETTYRLKRKYPDLKIVMLTSLNDSKAVQTGFKVKADGYCTKDTGLSEMMTVIDKVIAGDKWIDPRVAHFILEHKVPVAKGLKSDSKTSQPNKGSFAPNYGSAPNTPNNRPYEFEDQNRGPVMMHPIEDVLNSRELQILEMIANNMSNTEIATNLKISEAWISGYVENILLKLSVNNEIEAVQLGLDCGYLDQSSLLEEDQLA